MADISQITSGIQALSNLALVSPKDTVGYQPMNGKQAAGKALLFHYEGENTVSLESDITDHTIDDNTKIQDHIALHPEIITVQGFIGELNDVPPGALGALAAAVVSKLSALSAYAPSVSNAAVQAYNQAFQAYQLAQTAAASAVSAYNSLTSATGGVVIGSSGIATGQRTAAQNQQQTMFQQFYGYWRNRTLFTVQTPWAIFQNCAIMRVKATQDPETQIITTFEVTFKPLKFISTISTNGSQTTSDNYDGRAANQASAEVDLGVQPLGPTATFPVSGVA